MRFRRISNQPSTGFRPTKSPRRGTCSAWILEWQKLVQCSPQISDGAANGKRGKQGMYSKREESWAVWVSDAGWL